MKKTRIKTIFSPSASQDQHVGNKTHVGKFEVTLLCTIYTPVRMVVTAYSFTEAWAKAERLAKTIKRTAIGYDDIAAYSVASSKGDHAND